MLKTLLLLMFTLALSAANALGQIDPPKLDPKPPTQKESTLMNEAIALHDQGNYDEAISKYEEILKENPNNVEVIYEMSFSYSMKKDYRKSMELAYKGAQYKSELLAGFYMQIGNNLDQLGEPKKSVEVYKAGIKLQPRMAMLHYNLAVTYRNLGKPEDARNAVKQAIALNANHSSSNLFLSTLWYQGGYKAPALLAACRFLVLEPRSQRSPAALKTVKEIMGGGVTKGTNPDQINIFLDMSAKKDEGDFGAIDLILGLGKAASMTEKNKGKTQMQLLVGQFNTFFAVVSEQTDKGDKNKFTWKFYMPYFSEMKQRNYVEPFVYYIHQSIADEETMKWLTANRPRVDEFLSWSKAYPWPKEN